MSVIVYHRRSGADGSPDIGVPALLADRLLGYSAALEEEEVATVYEQRLAKALWSTPSSSLAGIAAKLEA